LREHGIELRTLVPGYPKVMAALAGGETVLRYHDHFGGAASLLAARVGDLDLIVLDAPHLFDRPGNPYLGPDGKDWPDNWRRFAALGFAAADIGLGNVAAFVPAVLHPHDWQAGLAPVYLRFAGAKAKSVITVHNLAFQGHFPA